MEGQPMRVLITVEHRFHRTPDGSIWTSTINAYSFWTRYLEVFDSVRVLARVADVDQPDPKWLRADGPQVEFCPVPSFIGPQQFLWTLPAVYRGMRIALSDEDAVIMRVPSVIWNKMARKLKREGRPFSLEVVGDPYDVFAPGGVAHPLRPVFRTLFSRALRWQCREADAVSYVTQRALQARYPSKALTVGVSDVVLPAKAFTTSYSSIELKSGHLLTCSRSRVPERGRATLVFIGSLAQLYKAPDVLIEAVAKAIRRGSDLRLRMVGDGRYRRMLEDLCRQLGIEQRCEFLGQLPGGSAVQDVLDGADMFVLPSRVEGLPRAMIEAMARGLPCIGTNVGGIPELLDPEDLVEPGNADALAEKIEKIVGDPERQRLMSARNLAEARNYVDEVLREKRITFYQYTRDITSEWLRRKAA
jgi:glycosyltransferase involved in cell wall biosynthesis